LIEIQIHGNIERRNKLFSDVRVLRRAFQCVYKPARRRNMSITLLETAVTSYHPLNHYMKIYNFEAVIATDLKLAMNILT